MSAREIIAKAVSDDLTGGWVEEYGETADAVIAALAATRYRILAPGELDPVTLERAAAALCDDCAKGTRLNSAGFHEIGSYTFPCHAAAIRALNTGGE